MTRERIVGICFCIVITSAVAAGQQTSGTTDQRPQVPARSVTERTFTTNDVAPSRRVQTRSESGGREIVVETSEVPDVEGRLTPTQETITETSRTAPGNAQTKRDVFGFNADRRRTLSETTESLQQTPTDGDTRAVHNTWARDLNGRLGLTARQIEQVRSAAPDVRQTDTTLLVPDLNGTLRETERTESTERRVSSGVVQERTHLVRDLNGRWQPVETRRGDAREIGATEHSEDETIQRRDMNGNLAVEERNVTRRSKVNEQDDEVLETYAPNADGLSGSNNRLALSQRVHRTTTATADGGRYTVEEVEGRNSVAPNDPMRVIRRTVTTVRPIGTDRWVTERQMFERDTNGRLRLVSNDTEDTAGR